MNDLSQQSFQEATQRLRPRIEAALDDYSRPMPGCPNRLSEALRYSLLAPGKRLRPLLVLLACETVGGETETAMPAAGAVEMIHAYSLIHDDLPAMDDDDLRRGRPTCHVQYDEATAILAGDALIPLAFETLATRIRPAGLGGQCCAVLAKAAGACELVGGQADDMAELGDNATAEDLEAIHRRKTGAMIRASLVLGAMCGGASEDAVASLDRYGECVGLAFQVTDDLLDVRGDEQAMGKRLRKDAEHDKATYPRLLGVEESELRAERLVREAIDALQTFDKKALPLVGLANYVLTRNH